MKTLATTSLILVLCLGSSCSLFKERLYDYQLPGTDQVLVVYRIPIGPTDRRFELRLESPRKSVLLHSRRGDWFEMACAAVVVLPDRPVINYLIAVTSPAVYMGAYDLSTEHKLDRQHVDQQALSREIARLYRGLPQFPESENSDLIDWATDMNSCREAFSIRYRHKLP